MDISLLKTFLEVARRRHFGKAAESLFVTQSAVSARIKLLESSLGIELFTRQRNDIRLTPGGLRLIRHAENIVKGWERARQEIALDDAGAKLLAAGCSLDMWQILFCAWAAELRRQEPHLVLQIEVQSAEVLVSRLNNGLLDLVLLFEPPQIPDLVINQVADIPLILVSGSPDCGLQQALEHDYYMVDWGSAFNRSHADYFPELPTPAARLASGMLARDLILATGGSAYLAEQMAQRELEQGKLFRVADAPSIVRPAFVIFRPGEEQRVEIQQALAVLKRISGKQ